LCVLRKTRQIRRQNTHINALLSRRLARYSYSSYTENRSLFSIRRSNGLSRTDRKSRQNHDAIFLQPLGMTIRSMSQKYMTPEVQPVGVEVGFKNLRFLNLKISKSPNFSFLGFFRKP